MQFLLLSNVSLIHQAMIQLKNCCFFFLIVGIGMRASFFTPIKFFVEKFFE